MWNICTLRIVERDERSRGVPTIDLTCITIIRPEETPAKATVTKKEECNQEGQAANGARLTFQKETKQVQAHEDDVVVEQ